MITHIQTPSALFPFSKDDIVKFETATFCLENVYKKIDDVQRQACVDLWLQNRVITSEQAAWERSEQVCYYITEKLTGKLIGVNTLYVDKIGSESQDYYFYRMFISPEFRGSRLMVTATALTLYFAKNELSNYGPLGVVNVNENRKLARTGTRKLFSNLGYRYVGEFAGQDVWLFDFARVQFVQS